MDKRRVEFGHSEDHLESIERDQLEEHGSGLYELPQLDCAPGDQPCKGRGDAGICQGSRSDTDLRLLRTDRGLREQEGRLGFLELLDG